MCIDLESHRTLEEAVAFVDAVGGEGCEALGERADRYGHVERWRNWTRSIRTRPGRPPGSCAGAPWMYTGTRASSA